MSKPTKQTLIAYVTEHQRLRKAIKVLAYERQQAFYRFEQLAWQLRSAYYITDNGQLKYVSIRASDSWGAAHDTLDILCNTHNRISSDVETTRQDFLRLQIENQCEAFDYKTYLANQLPIPPDRKQWYTWE